MNGRSSRNKGASYERQVVAWLRDHGWPAALRTRTPGETQDRGDIAGIPLVIEAKNHARLDLAGWLDQAEAAGRRANMPGVVWHKRRGTTDPGRHYVTMTGDTFNALLLKAGL